MTHRLMNRTAQRASKKGAKSLRPGRAVVASGAALALAATATAFLSGQASAAPTAICTGRSQVGVDGA